MNAIKSITNRSSKEWSTKGIKQYVLLMVEFLRLSPSFALAREEVLGGLNQAQIEQKLFAMYETADAPLSAATKASLLKDFELVQKTYVEFGDVYTMKFDDWWLKTGADLFGFDYERPRITKIAQLTKDESYSETAVAQLDAYLKNHRVKQGMPNLLILALPLGLPKRSLMMELSRLIDKTNIAVPPKAQKAKRVLTKQRLRSKPLFIYIRLLSYKSGNPSLSHWKLGLLAKVSPKHSEDMELDTKVSSKNIDQRMNLTVLTSRALRKAKLVAENAARGVFPSTDPRELPVFDWDSVYESLRIVYPNLKPRKK